MNAPNFSSILDESPSEVNAPLPVPQGVYLCVIQGTPRYDKSTKQQTPFVEFTLRPIAAEDDVDPEELESVGGLEGKTFRATFYLTEDAIYRLDEFHSHCGIDLDDGQSRRHRNDAVVNAQVRAFIKHQPSQDGTRIFAQFSRSLPAE
jgi:hypothetical protein